MTEAEMQKELGRRIKCLRKRRKMTQEQLAYRIRRSRTVVTNWERGSHKPTVWMLLCLAEALDVPAEEFLVPSGQFWAFYG